MSDKPKKEEFKREGFFELPVISAGPSTHSPSSQDPIIGIDLGTTNSLVAVIQDGKPVIIPTLEGKNLLPSIIHFASNGKIEIGYSAKHKRAGDPMHTIFSAKRLLGKGRADIENIREQLSYDIDSSSASNIRIRVDDKTLTPIEVSAMILRELKQAAENHLGRSIEDAVVTVPAYFNDSQRQATRAAGRLAGLNVLRILNEPTAAALAYGLQKKKNGLIAVYDLGGGTFDISILKLHNGIFEVLSTNGDTQLGGDDLDQQIVDWMIKRSELTALRKDQLSLLTEAAEKLKIALSFDEKASFSILLDGQQVNFDLTRSEFEKIVLPLLKRTQTPVENALKDAGIAKTELTDVILVGGPTRLSFIKNFVAELFGREPNSSMHPDEVVAQGAAIQADILAGNIQDLLLLDVVPLSLGIETFGGAMSKLISRNTRIPTLAKEQFTTYIDGQTKVAINVFQGERELVAENRKLAEFVLNDVPPLPAGVARIEVTFLVDADGILSVSAKEIYSEVEASVEVRPTYGLTDAQVEQMLEDGMNNAAQDADLRKLIENRNGARAVLTATEKSLPLVQKHINPAELQLIEKLISNLKNALNDSNVEQIQTARKALDQATVHMAEVLMNLTVETGIKNKNASDLIKK